MYLMGNKIQILNIKQTIKLSFDICIMQYNGFCRGTRSGYNTQIYSLFK